MRPLNRKKSSPEDAQKAPAEKRKFIPPKQKLLKSRFEPDPKDANTVNAIREKLRLLREYKALMAADGQRPDEADKEMESNLIKQLIRIEKGLTPKKKVMGRKKVKPKKKPQDSDDDNTKEAPVTTGRRSRSKQK